MILSDESRELVVTKLRDSGLLSQPCQKCRERRWQLSDRVLELREYQRGSLVLGGEQIVIPLIVAFCSNCGSLEIFNALILGVIDAKTGLLVGEKPAEESPND